MKRIIVLCALLLWVGLAAAQQSWRLGGATGEDWQEQTALNLMVDAAVVKGALQPLELQPDVNVVSQVGPWMRQRQPAELDYRIGIPRIWNGVGNVAAQGHGTEPLDFVDGDIETFFAASGFSGGGAGGAWGEYYTIDLGLQVPAERFVLVPPEGKNPFDQEPYRPNYTFEEYELTASNRPEVVNVQEPIGGGSRYYIPLDIPLASNKQNFDPVIDISFPLQYLQLFRMQLIPDAGGRFSRFAIAELEVYGRGFVPEARWESVVIDLGEAVNIGQVSFAVSRWRREGDQLVSAPGASAGATVAVKTGRDDSPITYFSYNDLQLPVEVTRKEYDRLKPRIFSWDPPAVGWRGPIVEDEDNWSFWSAPQRLSGQRPLVPKGRYLQLRVQLQTDSLWEFTRLDSLEVQFSPLLADRVLGEVAVADRLQPPGKTAQVEAGKPTEFVYDLRAEFGEDERAGFDAVRIVTPAAGRFRSLEMGEPLAAVDLAAEDVISEEKGFVVFLPRRVERGAENRLRLRFETAVYGASEQMRAEVFERVGATLPQEVEAGDVSDELGTDDLRVLGLKSSLGSLLGDVSVEPAILTPQGDGINDEVAIRYDLFQILELAEVEVAVLQLSGESVRSLLSQTQGAGRYSVSWDGRDNGGQVVEPGIYLVRIEVNADAGQRVRALPIAVAY